MRTNHRLLPFKLKTVNNTNGYIRHHIELTYLVQHSLAAIAGGMFNQ